MGHHEPLSKKCRLRVRPFTNVNLTGLGVLALHGLSGSPQYAIIPTSTVYDSVGFSVVDAQSARITTFPWQTFGRFTIDAVNVNRDFDIAVFQVAAVPIPAALPLFATGLAAMGLLGWRRKRKSAA